MYEHSRILQEINFMIFFRLVMFLFYPRILAYLVFSFWLHIHCMVWVPSFEVHPNSDQILVYHSGMLCDATALANFIGRTYYRSKILCLAWCPHFFVSSRQSTFQHQGLEHRFKASM